MNECDVVYIDDPSDPRLDDFRNLNHSEKRPDMPGGKGLVIAEGLLVVPRLIRSRFPARAIMGTDAKLHSLLADANLAEAIAKANIPAWSWPRLWALICTAVCWRRRTAWRCRRSAMFLTNWMPDGTARISFP